MQTEKAESSRLVLNNGETEGARGLSHTAASALFLIDALIPGVAQCPIGGPGGTTTTTLPDQADSDEDGIPEQFDNCPDTFPGSTVDSNGCSCVQKTCSDANRCTIDSCQSATAACGHAAILECCLQDFECADEDECTIDQCDPTGSCVNTALASCGSCTADSECRIQPGCGIGFCDRLTGKCQCPDLNLGAAYLALGDSFSAGEGVPRLSQNPKFETCTATDIDTFLVCNTIENKCHRSYQSYSRKLKLPGHNSKTIEQEATDGLEGAAFNFYACSGAVIANLKSGEGGKSRFGEAPQLTRPIESHTNLVTITIGGNDIGFVDMIIYCIADNNCQDDLQGVFSLINRKVPELTQLYLQAKEKTKAPVFVFLYPQIVTSSACVSTGLTITSAELSFFRNVTSSLNIAIIQAAKTAGVHWVDSLTPFAGHEVCGTKTPWFNGLVRDTKEYVYSFHPNELGHQGFADSLANYIRQKRASGWAPGFSSLGLPNNPAPIVAATPASSSSIEDPGPSISLGSLEIQPQGPQRCTGLPVVTPDQVVRLIGTGFEASASVILEAKTGGEADGVVLASVVADERGALDSMASLPATLPTEGLLVLTASGTAAGTEHTLVLIGAVPAVSSGSADTDTDGVDNACDNCDLDANADQEDFDGDGVGDACDACPEEFSNDLDGDGECAPEDACPLDPFNDEDGDGICGDKDGCPWVFDPNQGDEFADGFNDACSSICGSPVKHATQPISSDCLHILRAAVSLGGCTMECICDTNGDKSIKASDALQCLRRAVGGVQALACGC